MSKISGKRVAKNMFLSVVAQAVSVLVGFILNLIVPKFISETDYSLWQSYLLYSQYLGILHFGLMDGIVLRYSQFDYDELDKSMIRAQYRTIMRLDLLLSLCFLSLAFLFFKEIIALSVCCLPAQYVLRSLLIIFHSLFKSPTESLTMWLISLFTV